MAVWLVVLLFSVGAVLLFTVGLSLTLMIKGHDIDGEISTNRNMRERGINCVAAEERVGLKNCDFCSGASENKKNSYLCTSQVCEPAE